MAIRKTGMHQTIIAQANEMGYFPTVEQADQVWNQFELTLVQQRIATGAKPTAKDVDDTLRRSIETVLGTRKEGA